MIDKDLIRINLNFDNSGEVIELLSGLLRNGGYVNDGFKDAIIEREKRFPTGLSTGGTGFAIPHTDSRYVKKSAVSIGILNHPVKFGEMGDPEHKVDVDIVIMPAIRNPGKVVPFLKEICSLLQDKALVARLHACVNPEEVVNILASGLTM